jgi:hypothetical protein
MKNNNTKRYFIIEEAYFSRPDIIDERKVGDGKYKIFFKAILQEAGNVNQNKRVYSPAVLEKVVNQLKPLAENRELLCELDHPWIDSNDPDLLKKRASRVHLSDACALIRKIDFDGKYVIAELETLTTRKGLDLYALIKDGVNIGFSLRALGSVTPNNNGTLTVGEDIKAITYDVVSRPSHSGARIFEVMSEDINNFIFTAKNTGDVLFEDATLYEDDRKVIVLLPPGVKIIDVDDDEIENLERNDNVNVQSFGVAFDARSDTIKICKDNVCRTLSLNEFLRYISRNGEYYPVAGYLNITRKIEVPEDTKPLVSYIDLEKTRNTLYPPEITIPDTEIEEPEEEEERYSEEDINKIINDIIAREYPDLYDQELPDNVLDKIYTIASEDNEEEKQTSFFEDMYDVNYDIFVPEVNEKVKSNEIELDYIDEGFEYETDYDRRFISAIDYLNYIYEEVFEEKVTAPELIDNLHNNIKEIISELNSVPDFLRELFIEDEKYAPENINIIQEISESISNEQLNTLINHLFEDYYRELKSIYTALVEEIGEFNFMTFIIDEIFEDFFTTEEELLNG